MDASQFKALSFDCYGTLIDWETGIVAAAQPWITRTGIELEREELLRAFGAIETEVESKTPSMLYPHVLAETLKRIGARLEAPVSDDEAVAFGNSVGDWPPFPDSAEALARLKTRFKLIILSNVNKASFALSQQRLGVAFDLVITAEDVGSYKPDQRNFDQLFSELPKAGIERNQLLHVAESLYHDHGPAQRNDLPSVWIHRRHGKDGTGATHPPVDVRRPEWEFPSMAAFADAALG